MEGNKDESEKCIDIALKHLRIGDKIKALKFLHKAQRLYPSDKAKSKSIVEICHALWQSHQLSRRSQNQLGVGGQLTLANHDVHSTVNIIHEMHVEVRWGLNAA